MRVVRGRRPLQGVIGNRTHFGTITTLVEQWATARYAGLTDDIMRYNSLRMRALDRPVLEPILFSVANGSSSSSSTGSGVSPSTGLIRLVPKADTTPRTSLVHLP